MLKSLFLYFMFVVCLRLSAVAQQTTELDSDWQILLDDSLAISGNYNTNNASRPIAVIDIDNGEFVKQLTFIYKTARSYNKHLQFKENDSTLFKMTYYADHSRILDTLIIDPKNHSESLKSLKGRTVKMYYSDDMLQTTPTLLGTLIVKKD